MQSIRQKSSQQQKCFSRPKSFLSTRTKEKKWKKQQKIKFISQKAFSSSHQMFRLQSFFPGAYFFKKKIWREIKFIKNLELWCKFVDGLILDSILILLQPLALVVVFDKATYHSNISLRWLSQTRLFLPNPYNLLFKAIKCPQEAFLRLCFSLPRYFSKGYDTKQTRKAGIGLANLWLPSRVAALPVTVRLKVSSFTPIWSVVIVS